MYYITAYKNKTPVQGYTNPEQVLDALSANKSHKKTFLVESPNMLRYTPKRTFINLGRMLLCSGCNVQPIRTDSRHTDYILKATIDDVVESLNLSECLSHMCKTNWYKTFNIPKRSGGVRTIKAPVAVLKQAQKAIYKYLSEELGIIEHECAYGFVKGRNCKTSLKIHQDNHSRWFLKIDFHDFFPSFTTEVLMRQLRYNAGIEKFISTDLEKYLYVCTGADGRLVQGSPSSPYLANIAMIPFDYAFDEYCKEHNLIYTRYADDILVSSAYTFNWQGVKQTVLELLSRLGYDGFSLSEDKTRYGNFNGANWNLGLMYNNQFNITVGHENKRLLKVIAHKWNTLTPEEQEHWRGIFNYYRYIEPEYFAQERFSICLRE